MKKITSLLLALLLTFTLIFVVACNNTDNNDNGDNETPKTETSSTVNQGSTDNKPLDKIPAEGLWKDAIYRNDTELGNGEKNFILTVEIDGQSVSFTIKTNKSSVGEALLELNLIEGEDGAYGLYVKKVNGVTADYDTDRTYWAFYINGEYAMAGVDGTQIVNGATYKLSREK